MLAQPASGNRGALLEGGGEERFGRMRLLQRKSFQIDLRLLGQNPQPLLPSRYLFRLHFARSQPGKSFSLQIYPALCRLLPHLHLELPAAHAPAATQPGRHQFLFLPGSGRQKLQIASP